MTGPNKVAYQNITDLLKYWLLLVATIFHRMNSIHRRTVIHLRRNSCLVSSHQSCHCIIWAKVVCFVVSILWSNELPLFKPGGAISKVKVAYRDTINELLSLLSRYRRPLVLWCGNGTAVLAIYFCALWLWHFAGSCCCEQRSLALFYWKAYSYIVSSLATGTGPIPKIDGECLRYVGCWTNTKHKYCEQQNNKPC